MRFFSLSTIPLTLICCFFSLKNTVAQDITKSVFDLFHQPDLLPEIELQFDIESYIENKNTNEYQPATLTWIKSKDVSMGWNIQLKPRGRFRRRICSIPPIKLRFDKSEMREEGRKHPSIKLVTNCLDGLAGKELVAKEQLVYELFEVITDESLRTQLVEVKYLDDKGRKFSTNYGILIEDADQAAKTMGGKICDNCMGRDFESFDRSNLDINALFQFMIGNEDWSYTMVRNIEVVKFDKEGEENLKMLPYDFDFSGFVNASYAIPNVDFGLTNCRQRFFLGEGETTNDIMDAINHFKEKEDAVYEHIKSYPYLKKRSKSELISYVSHFYEFIHEKEQSLTKVLDYHLPGAGDQD